LVLRQRVAGDVEVERLLLVLELLRLGPLGHVGQRHVGGDGGPALGEGAEQAHLPGLAVALQVAGRLDGARQDVQQLRPPAAGGRGARRPKRSKAPALMSFSTAALGTTRPSTRSQKSKRSLNDPPSRRARTISSAAPRPRPLIAVRPTRMLPPTTVNSGPLALISGGSTAMPRRRASAMCSTMMSRLLPSSISLDNSAAMNSAVKCAFRYAVW